MTITYETAVTLVEQLSPLDQARLVALLAERLQQTLQPELSQHATDEPAFWHVVVDDSEGLESESPDAVVQPSAVTAHTETQAMITRWFGTPLSEEDALDLAMSSSIAEWNLDL
jgi:hypothetical protein